MRRSIASSSRSLDGFLRTAYHGFQTKSASPVRPLGEAASQGGQGAPAGGSVARSARRGQAAPAGLPY